METATDNPERKTFARFLPPTARIVLGLILLFFGLNGFLQFMPPPGDMPQDIMTVMGALMKAGYLQVVSGTMVLVGLLLLVNCLCRSLWPSSPRSSSGYLPSTYECHPRPSARELLCWCLNCIWHGLTGTHSRRCCARGCRMG